MGLGPELIALDRAKQERRDLLDKVGELDIKISQLVKDTHKNVCPKCCKSFEVEIINLCRGCALDLFFEET